MLLQKLLSNSIFLRFSLNGFARTVCVILFFNFFYLFISYELSLFFSLILVLGTSFFINIRYVFVVPIRFKNFFAQLVIAIIYYFLSIILIDFLSSSTDLGIRPSQLISTLILFPISFILTKICFCIINK